MRWLYKLEYKYGRYYIRNLMTVVVIGMVGWDEGRFRFEEILRKSEIFVCESVIFSQTTIVLLIAH